jgi:hypothetical protein
MHTAVAKDGTQTWSRYVPDMNRPDPFTLPEWKALHREASLVSQIIGSGATALGRASYGRGFGEYYAAFFGLSIGIERLASSFLSRIMQWTMAVFFRDSLSFGNMAIR